jgi:16S rRNA (guanine(966)-N(2))-methyltransferase RsmD
MRVIGGEFRSRKLKGVEGLETRPTPDRLRESLFSILAPRLAECRVFADLYAGTGTVGIEALSRGVEKALFIEKSRAAVQVLRENIRSLRIEDRADIRQGSAASMISLVEADIVFLDPPYKLEKEYALILEGVQGADLVLAQHASRFALEDRYGAYERTRVLKQGDNSISFFRRTE